MVAFDLGDWARDAVGGSVLLLTGIWRRRGGDSGDGWDDGAAV